MLSDERFEFITWLRQAAFHRAREWIGVGWSLPRVRRVCVPFVVEPADGAVHARDLEHRGD